MMNFKLKVGGVYRAGKFIFKIRKLTLDNQLCTAMNLTTGKFHSLVPTAYFKAQILGFKKEFTGTPRQVKANIERLIASGMFV